MNVKIVMDRAPTNRNKKLMSFLLKNVSEYRSCLQMSIVTIPKKNHKTLDANITALPAAYIGTNIVIGYKDIIRSIAAAYNQRKLYMPDDPIQSFWDKSIKQGLGEIKKENNDDEDMASRFTESIRRRKKAYESRAPSFKNKNTSHSNADDNFNGASEPPPDMKKNRAPTTTEEMILQHTDDNVTRVGDYDDPMKLETDPHMKMFWANQSITPDT